MSNRDNERVRSEMFQSKPKKQAVSLLKELKNKVTIQAHKDAIDEIIEEVKDL